MLAVTQEQFMLTISLCPQNSGHYQAIC